MSDDDALVSAKVAGHPHRKSLELIKLIIKSAEMFAILDMACFSETGEECLKACLTPHLKAIIEVHSWQRPVVNSGPLDCETTTPIGDDSVHAFSILG